MIFIKKLWFLLATHAITDCILQDPKIFSIGEFKNPKNTNHWPYWLFAHGVVNGLGVYLITNSYFCFILETFLHFLIDLGKMKNIYSVHIDQLFHFLCKIIWSITCVI